MSRHTRVTVGSFDQPAPSSWPTSATTGPTGTLDTHPGTSFGSNGATYDGYHFTSLERLTLGADDVTFTNCTFEGHFYFDEVGGTVLSDCQFVRGATISSSSGLLIERAKVENFIPDDGFHITSDGASLCSDITIRDSYVYNALAVGEAHADGLQVRGSLRLTLAHCYVDMGPWNDTHNAAFYLENANGGNTDWLAEDCYFKTGNGYSLYIHSPGGAGIFRNNTVARGAFGYQYDPAPANVTGSGNVDENGNAYDIHNPPS